MGTTRDMTSSLSTGGAAGARRGCAVEKGWV